MTAPELLEKEDVMEDHAADSRQIISGPPGKSMPFSVAVGYGPFVFLSGLVGRDPVTGAIAAGDVGAQTAQTLRNAAAHLAAGGSGLDRVLKATVFLTDMGALAAMNEAYRTAFPADPPARSCVQVVRLPDPQALVEIELVAARG
jgi:2-iminobutanoate/2-iminopropanoate deaminase